MSIPPDDEALDALVSESAWLDRLELQAIRRARTTSPIGDGALARIRRRITSAGPWAAEHDADVVTPAVPSDCPECQKHEAAARDNNQAVLTLLDEIDRLRSEATVLEALVGRVRDCSARPSAELINAFGRTLTRLRG